MSSTPLTPKKRECARIARAYSHENEKLASEILSLAAALDPRFKIEPNGATLAAWKVWLREQENIYIEDVQKVVVNFYNEPQVRPIQTGNIREGLSALPWYSSRGRTRDQVRKWAVFPYSGRIEAAIGMPPGRYIVDDLLGDERGEADPNRGYLVSSDDLDVEKVALQKYVEEHMSEILQDILADPVSADYRVRNIG